LVYEALDVVQEAAVFGAHNRGITGGGHREQAAKKRRKLSICTDGCNKEET